MIATRARFVIYLALKEINIPEMQFVPLEAVAMDCFQSESDQEMYVAPQQYVAMDEYGGRDAFRGISPASRTIPEQFVNNYASLTKNR